MGVKDIKRIAVKAIAMLAMTAVVAGIGSAYVDPVDVEADTKYDTLYDVFKARSGKGDDGRNDRNDPRLFQKRSEPFHDGTRTVYSQEYTAVPDGKGSEGDGTGSSEI